MPDIISIENLSKRYKFGHLALKSCTFGVEKGEVFALLGANGAGKTTLISIVCGIVNPSGGCVSVNGYDVIKDYRQTREMIGLVPQELTLPMFETVLATVSHSRSLFGKPPSDAYTEKLLKTLTLWDKRHNNIRQLSGGMKRRVLIAKALSHEPQVLFLDEPTAGVDVTLRKDMWNVIKQLRESGVTIILTTHYLEEAEMLADRVGIMRNGELLLLEDKQALLNRLGNEQLCFNLNAPLKILPQALIGANIKLSNDGEKLFYYYNNEDKNNLNTIISLVLDSEIHIKRVETNSTSLEDIFVSITA